ncbi:uncharacterized protein LOC120709748 [Panicum virgatum]|uniref:Uncharacterized protein n=1 Tax=Panicum virgatum TaxID=38727 RepID=A0A8T0SL14_PANVG|nr:uncharacterized protein LOC120709748 [Panicum virgatum]KAG2597166.1 hypothetical protein PVAP13_5KG198700 [Panicum virgatum]
MENGGGAKPTTRFGFSWADEVEREEREQAGMQQQQQEEARREQIKPDPFGAARPREVVLAEKGVDWRARDRELDLCAAPRGPPRSAARRRRHAAAAATAAAASACTATPARGVPLDRDAGRTPHPRRQGAAASTPRPPPTGRGNAASIGRSARGGSKRKFAGEAPARQARPAGDHAEQGRRGVFRELNVGNGCCCGSNPGGSLTEGMKAAGAAAADGAPSAGESAAGQKRGRGAKRTRGRGSGKAKEQQAQPT